MAPDWDEETSEDDGLEDIDYHWSGETLHLEFTIFDGDSSTEDDPKNLDGATIEWALLERSNEPPVLYSEEDDGVSTELTTPSEGKCEVRIEAGATGELGTDSYDERLKIVDSAGSISYFGATFGVVKPGI